MMPETTIPQPDAFETRGVRTRRGRTAVGRAACAVALLGLGIATTVTADDAPEFPNCGAGAAGPCDDAHGGPGCTWNLCCVSVCAFDPTCCEISWNEFCVKLTQDFCDDLVCGGPDTGPCLTANETRGCSDEACCAFVCQFDPFCCSGRWDAWCAAEAEMLCGAVPCQLEIPAGARLEGEECGERINDGCNRPDQLFDAIACGEIVVGTSFTGAPRDTDWYEITLAQATSLTITLASEFPAEVMIVQGPCNATRVLAQRSAFGCVASMIEIELDAGAWWIVVSTATNVRPMHRGLWCPDPEDQEAPDPAFDRHYLLQVACDGGPGLIGDLNGDGVVDGADLGILLSTWGPCDGCPADLNGDGVVDGADLGILLSSWS